ncbi:MAG: acyl-CoA/acyl-ACP dehydrogenase [Nannocystaceae bacterium]|nr:acyl-CoA/acyl-ACP dehydrogenase [Nannocystaceae bacterium]
MPSLSTALNLAREMVPQLRENAAAVDAEAAWPEANLRALQACGLGGLVVPEEHGGMGLGLGALVRVGELLGQACASTAMCFGMHSVGSAVIAARANPEQGALLRAIAAGNHLTTLALSETGSGAHFYLPATQLRRDAGDVQLTGQKSFVTNGGHADSYVVSCASADPDAPPGEFSCVVVPAQTEGLTWKAPWAGLGMRGNSSRTVDIDINLPASAFLGESGDQMWFVLNVVAPFFLCAMSGTYLGIATAALNRTIEHLKHREHEHTGLPLSANQVLQHRTGQLWAANERTRCFTQSHADASDAGEPNLAGILSSKAEVADAAVWVVNECMTLCGGRAYAEAGDFGRNLRDLRAVHVMSPTTDLLRTWVGRLLLDERLFSD